jgi:hypothetical protein
MPYMCHLYSFFSASSVPIWIISLPLLHSSVQPLFSSRLESFTSTILGYCDPSLWATGTLTGWNPFTWQHMLLWLTCRFSSSCLPMETVRAPWWQESFPVEPTPGPSTWLLSVWLLRILKVKDVLSLATRIASQPVLFFVFSLSCSASFLSCYLLTKCQFFFLLPFVSCTVLWAPVH